MSKLDRVEMLKTKLGTEGEGPLLELLLKEAEDTVLDIVGRDKLPERLESAVVSLAAIAYNRRGTEGESSHGEGGVSVSMIDGLPADIKERLRNYPRKVGVMRGEA